MHYSKLRISADAASKLRTLRQRTGLTPTPPGGDIIPEWGARIDRNAGRQLIGTGGRHHSGIGGRLAPESAWRVVRWMTMR